MVFLHNPPIAPRFDTEGGSSPQCAQTLGYQAAG